MAEVFNNHTVTGHKWNINGLGNKMADPDLLEFIRE